MDVKVNIRGTVSDVYGVVLKADLDCNATYILKITHT